MELRLSAEQKSELRKAILSAFDDRDFAILVDDHLGVPLANLTERAELPYMVLRVIQKAEGHGWLAKLVRGVMLERPDNPDVIRLLRQLGLHPILQPKSQFEAFVGANRCFHDANQFFHRGYVMGTRVCQVRRNSDALGTGFLVGPDAVLTNWHVMKGAARPLGGAAGYEFVFGFARTSAGDAIDDGEVFRAAEAWHVASAVTGTHESPAEDELDFALVRLAEPAGELFTGRTAHGTPRGSIELSADRPDFSRRGLGILQHPVVPGAGKHPLKLAFDATAQAVEVSSGHRVRYPVPTLGGSSGSPVFDLETWTLIALHQLGACGQYNQGIPTWRIARHPDVKRYLDDIE
jgi:hypothetical protein